jgi:hypothetical protein
MEMKIGDRMKIPTEGKAHPEEGHFGRIVWVKEDGKTVAIQCEGHHEGKKNVVFLVRFDSGK